VAGVDVDSTSGRTDVGRWPLSEVTVSLTAAQRADIRQLLARQAQLLRVREPVLNCVSSNVAHSFPHPSRRY